MMKTTALHILARHPATSAHLRARACAQAQRYRRRRYTRGAVLFCQFLLLLAVWLAFALAGLLLD